MPNWKVKTNPWINLRGCIPSSFILQKSFCNVVTSCNFNSKIKKEDLMVNILIHHYKRQSKVSKKTFNWERITSIGPALERFVQYYILSLKVWP